MAKPKLYISTDNYIKLTGVKKASDGTVITGATINVSVVEESPLTVQQSRLEFSGGGPYEIKVGDVIEGATSTAYATVTGVTVDSGAWPDSDAVGHLDLEGQGTTAFQAEDVNVGTHTDVATIAGDSTGVEDDAGKAKVTIASHTFAADDYLWIERSDNYDGLQQVGTPYANKVKLAADYVAEKPRAGVKAYAGIPNGCGIALSDQGGGTYHGQLPNTMKRLARNDKYFVFVAIDGSGLQKIECYDWPGVYANES